MTICLASRAVSAASFSGVARASVELAVALARAGHSVHLLTRSVDAPALDVDGLTVHAIAAPPPLAAGGADDAPLIDHLAHAAAVHRAVSALHEQEPIDAVVAPLWCCEGVVCMLDERFPTVVSCMTSMSTIRELRPGLDVSRDEQHLIALERATMRRARYVHGLTRGALDKTLADYPADPLEVSVVGRGLLDHAGASGPEPRRGAGAPRILFVGRLERRKGVDVLLEAARLLSDAGRDFELTLVGPDGQDGEGYRGRFERAAAADLDLAARVRFAGAVDDAELHRLYRAADVVCVPSRYESHGVVLIEAMMFGQPIVACAAGGVPEVVEADGNALLAAPDDPESLAALLRRLLDDPALRRRLGTRSRELYEERFAADRVAARMAEFLGRVAERHPNAAEAPRDLPERLAAVISDVLGTEAEAAARELVAPSAASWDAAVLSADRERAAWQARAAEAERQVEAWRARALEAERQRADAEATLGSVTRSRSWRLARPARTVGSALRRVRVGGAPRSGT